MHLPILYKRTSSGAIQQWEIIVYKNTFRTIYGQVGGQLVYNKGTICKGKNIGKKNESTPEQQAETEAKAKWEKQLKKNYKVDITKVDEKTFFEPMLAKQFIDYKDKIVYPVAIEDKLNGIRCVITKNGAFSRKGEQFFCIDHIKDALIPLFKMYPDAILDGELFNPIYKNRLNKISELVSVNRKEKDISEDDIKNSKEIVQYHIYDAINYGNCTISTHFFERKLELNKLIKNIQFCYYVSPDIANNIEDIEKALLKSKNENREGIMIKILNAPYENKRSKYFLKYKNFKDEEFEVLGFKEGKGNWTGCVKMVTCRLNKPATDGRLEFDSNIRGNMEDLKNLWETKDDHIGKKITVEYQEMSEFGIPLIPYCDCIFRTYESKTI